MIEKKGQRIGCGHKPLAQWCSAMQIMLVAWGIMLLSTPVAGQEVAVEADTVIAYASSHLGAPYRYGGKSPKGFDCAGFTRYVFLKYGLELAASAGGQYRQCEHVADTAVQPGDLVFYGGRGGGEAIGHVGLVTEVDSSGFRFIHAASDGVRYTRSTEPYYRKRYKGIGRPIHYKENGSND